MIDVIIPGYNCKETLFDCLESIRRQSAIDKIHVIFVDDCSTDDYSDILAHFQEAMDLKCIRTETNKGPGFCRQLGLDNSSSEFVMFVDSDDFIIGDDTVARFLRAASNKYDYVFGLVYCELLDACVAREGNLHGKMYRRSFLNKHGIRFSSDRYHEDNLFNNLVLLNGAKVKCLEDVTYCYFDNKDSLTNRGLNDYQTYLEGYIRNIGLVSKYHKEKQFDQSAFEGYLVDKRLYLNFVYNNSSDARKEFIDQLLDRYDVQDIIH